MKPAEVPLQSAIDAADDQQVYARLLERWSGFGALLLLCAFGAGLLGWLPPRLAFDRLPSVWGLPVEHMLAAGGGANWSGLAHASAGDLASLFAIAWLASGPPLCLLALVPAHARRRDRVQVIFCVGLVALMVFAALG